MKRLHELIIAACNGEDFSATCLVTGETLRAYQFINKRQWSQAHVLSEWKLVENKDVSSSQPKVTGEVLKVDDKRL
jgi:hypothetical protein